MENAYDTDLGDWVISKTTLEGTNSIIPTWDLKINKEGKISDVESELENQSSTETLG